MARHPADLLSLAFGLLFAAIGLAMMLGGVDALAMEWIAPLGAIALGVVFIVTARSSRRASGDESSEA